MIQRRLELIVQERLGQFPAVALLGPRQVGKTTLAQGIAAGRDSVYLDLESARDREKLTDPQFLSLGARRATGRPRRSAADAGTLCRPSRVDRHRADARQDVWAIDIKRGLGALPEKGFFIACDDVKPVRRCVVNSGTERHTTSRGVDVIGLAEMATTLLAL